MKLIQILFVIPEGTVIAPMNYLVLSRDTLSFRNYNTQSLSLLEISHLV